MTCKVAPEQTTKLLEQKWTQFTAPQLENKQRKKKKNISAQMTHTHYQAQWWSRDDFGLFQNHRIWATCSH